MTDAEQQMEKIRKLPIYQTVLQSSKQVLTQAEHYFDCCLLVHEIHRSIGEVLSEVWDHLAKQELRELEYFLDPKLLSATHKVGEMLYTYKTHWNNIRGKFGKSALLKLSEQSQDVRNTIFNMELKRNDPLPSSLAVKALGDLCNSLTKGSKKKDKEHKKPFEQVNSQLSSAFRLVIKELDQIKGIVGQTDFSNERSKEVAHGLHELVGAADVQMMQIKDLLRSHFQKVPWYVRLRK
jgi:hypothetical protein